jgi:uncharacterized protein (DUF427 family)
MQSATWQVHMTDSDVFIRPVSGRAHVSFDGAEIGSSLNALELHQPGAPVRIYFPRDDIQPGILELSESRGTDPVLGEIHYSTIKTLTATGPDQAWFHPEPPAEFADLTDLIAFSGDRIEHRFSEV